MEKDNRAPILVHAENYMKISRRSLAIQTTKKVLAVAFSGGLTAKGIEKIVNDEQNGLLYTGFGAAGLYLYGASIYGDRLQTLDDAYKDGYRTAQSQLQENTTQQEE